MGALPKRKPSTHRQGKRRGSQKASLPRLAVCPHCGSEKLPQFACPQCGKWEKDNGEKRGKSRSAPSKKKKGS